MPRPTPPPVSHEPASLTIPTPLAGERLDRAVAEMVAGLTRARARRLIDAGHVLLNGAPGKPSLTVRAGDAVCLTQPVDTGAPTLEPEAIPLDVVFEDEAVLVVNKSAGLVVHPAPGHATGTLVNALLHHTGGALARIGAPERPGIVHRLDRYTSGLLVVAKTPAAHAALGPQFAAHSIRREYLSLVWGTFAERAGTIDAPIGRSVADRKRMAIAGLNGRAARTHFTVAAGFPEASELRLRLETGRTHQVRVHCAYIGHGVIGDPTYGSPPPRGSTSWPPALRKRLDALPGQMLHAAMLGLTHPTTGETVQWEAPPPKAYAQLRAGLAALGTA